MSTTDVRRGTDHDDGPVRSGHGADGPVLTFGLAGHADVRVTGLTLDRPSFTLRTAGASAPGAARARRRRRGAGQGLPRGGPRGSRRRPRVAGGQ
jgi:hypothetical protein